VLDRPRVLAALALCITTAALLAAGCGGDDDDAEAGATTAGAAPAALPIEERVVDGELGGLAPAGPPLVASTPEEFFDFVGSDESDEEEAAFRRAGFVEGAVQLYMVTTGPGLSAVAQLGSPQQALAEAERIGKDFASGLPPGATEEPLPGVPGSSAIVVSESNGGQTLRHGSAVFADGPFVYAQLVAGTSADIDPHAVVDAAAALYEKVQGSPAP
jgi:hypothetical protein